MTLKWFLAFLLVPVAVLMVACRDVPEKRSETPPIAVNTAAVRTASVPERLEAGGVVAASRTATLSSRIVAPVRELRVRTGQIVRAGQVLVVLDGRDLEAHATQAAAAAGAATQGASAANTDLAAATAEHTLATSWHRRISALHAKDSATTQELEEAQARVAGAVARLEGAKARVQQAGSTATATGAAADAASTVRGFATVVAPFDGLVTETFADPGNLASPGVPLLRIESTGTKRVEVLVDENRARFVRVGDTVEVQVGDGGSASAESQEGKVVEVAGEMASGQRAFTVKVELPREASSRTGTFARIRFAGPSRDAVLVPDSAVVRHGQVASAFVVHDGVARLRLLHLGEVLAGEIEVLAGLDDGETVVISPPPGLVEGRTVTVAAGDRR